MGTPQFTAANANVSVAPSDLIVSAFKELGVGGQGEALQAEDQANGREAVQRRIDLVNAQKPLIYAVNFTLFNTPPNTSPITIGPGQTFNVPSVPVRIKSASWLLPSGPVDLPVMNDLSDDEYAEIALKSLTSTLPTALYYSRGAAVGNIFLLPIPTQGNQIRLQLWNPLAQAIDLNTPLALPPAYWMYLVCAVASDLAPSYGPQALEFVNSPSFMLKYHEASDAIRSNNQQTPPMRSGIPSSKSNRSAIPDYNFLTGYRG